MEIIICDIKLVTVGNFSCFLELTFSSHLEMRLEQWKLTSLLLFFYEYYYHFFLLWYVRLLFRMMMDLLFSSMWNGCIIIFLHCLNKHVLPAKICDGWRLSCIWTFLPLAFHNFQTYMFWCPQYVLIVTVSSNNLVDVNGVSSGLISRDMNRQHSFDWTNFACIASIFQYYPYKIFVEHEFYFDMKHKYMITPTLLTNML